MIESEYQRTEKWIRKIAQIDELLDENPLLKTSLTRRDPLSGSTEPIQLELLHRYRSKGHARRRSRGQPRPAVALHQCHRWRNAEHRLTQRVPWRAACWGGVCYGTRNQHQGLRAAVVPCRTQGTVRHHGRNRIIPDSPVCRVRTEYRWCDRA